MGHPGDWPLRFSELVEGFLNLVFPARTACYGCGRPLGEPGFLCRGCYREMRRPFSRVCSRCGKPFLQAGLCGECREEPRYFELSRSLGLYRGVLKKCLYRLKYGGQEFLGKPLGEMMGGLVLEGVLGERRIDVVVPVPLHRQRRRQRGFNQAEVLARAVANRVEAYLSTHWLVREKTTPPLSQASRGERRVLLAGAFRLAEGVHREVLGKRVLLVDDIFTTGATLNECARVLLGGGAAQVFGLTAAIGAQDGDQNHLSTPEK